MPTASSMIWVGKNSPARALSCHLQALLKGSPLFPDHCSHKPCSPGVLTLTEPRGRRGSQPSRGRGTKFGLMALFAAGTPFPKNRLAGNVTSDLEAHP
jgi:hypothetical protein